MLVNNHPLQQEVGMVVEIVVGMVVEEEEPLIFESVEQALIIV